MNLLLVWLDPRGEARCSFMYMLCLGLVTMSCYTSFIAPIFSYRLQQVCWYYKWPKNIIVSYAARCGLLVLQWVLLPQVYSCPVSLCVGGVRWRLIFSGFGLLFLRKVLHCQSFGTHFLIYWFCRVIHGPFNHVSDNWHCPSSKRMMMILLIKKTNWKLI